MNVLVKTALIFGATGQDGISLTNFLASLNYNIHKVIRQSSSVDAERIDHLIPRDENCEQKVFSHHGDLTDGTNLTKLISKIQPDEIYNLGSFSDFTDNSKMPEYCCNVNALGTLRILEAIRTLK